MEDKDISMQVQELLWDNKPFDALKLINPYTELHQSETGAYYWKGIALIFLKKYQEAIEALEIGETKNPLDRDILFALGIAHLALSNHGNGKSYFEKYQQGHTPEKDEVIGNASMVAMAKLFLPALLFLEHVNDNQESPDPEIKQFANVIFQDCIRYALEKSVSLKNQRLMMHNIDPILNKHALKGLIKRLLSDLHWQDAIYLYRNFIATRCAQGCINIQNSNDLQCVKCITEDIFPGSFLKGLIE